MDKNRPPSSYLIPSIADLFFVTTLFVLFFSSKCGLLGDGDTGYHIRAGEYILRTGSIPKFDIFSYHTPPLPWTAHEWLAEALMGAVHQVAGLTGVIAFYAVLLGLITYVLFKVLMAHGTNILVATVIAILAFASCQIHWLARPHVFSFLLMISYQYLLESWRSGGKNRLYLLPLLMLLWVNLHGGFVGGFMLVGAYLAGSLFHACTKAPAGRAAEVRKAKQLAAALVGCIAASLVNPRGYQILLFPFKLVSDQFMMDHVAEFLSPNFHNWLPFKYLLLLMIALMAFSRRRLDATDFVLMLGFTNMALYSARYIPLFSLVMAPVLCRHAGELEGVPHRKISEFLRKKGETLAAVDATLRGHLWPLAAVVLVAATILSGSVSHGFNPKIKCVAATEFLMKEQIPGNVFNNDEFGDYLIYRGYQSYKVFIDGRLDMYGSERLKEYMKVANFKPGWEETLNRYGITWVFFDTNSNLSRYLQKDRRWVLIYSDRVASIFVRDLPLYREIIRKHRLGQLASIPDPEEEETLSSAVHKPVVQREGLRE
jgi:hypothetical protein